MAGILVVGEARQGELREVSRELVTLGLGLKAEGAERLAVALIAPDAADLAGELALVGVDEVLVVKAPGDGFDAHVQQQAVEALIEQEDPALVLVGHTVDSLGYAPALAAKLGLGFASDVTHVALEGGASVATRSFYGGKLEAELEFPDKSRVLCMVRGGAYPPTAGSGEPEAPERVVDVPFEDSPSHHISYVEVEQGDVDITAAEFLLSIGRGVEDKDNIPQFEELAEKMGATLSVSRPLVDAGWMPGDRQVGQSGKTVKPKVYLALGISGAVQHLAGMRTAEVIIAVNTDPEAPIFNVAHYGAVADMFDLADELGKQFG